MLEDFSGAEIYFKRAVAGFGSSLGMRAENTKDAIGSLLEVLHEQRKYEEVRALRKDWIRRGGPTFEAVINGKVVDEDSDQSMRGTEADHDQREGSSVKKVLRNRKAEADAYGFDLRKAALLSRF